MNIKYGTFVALDLELNQPSGKIIQIGIAIGNIHDSPEQYITRQWYINPGEPISEFITQLTGITNEDIDNYSVEYISFVDQLQQVLAKYTPFINPVTWGCGDLISLRSQIEASGIEFPCFGKRWIDVKTWYTLYMFSRNRSPKGGLKSAMSEFKMKFTGSAHQADVDAANTLALFFKFLKRQSEIEGLINKIKEI